MDLTIVYASVLLGNILLVILLSGVSRIRRTWFWAVRLCILAFFRCKVLIRRRLLVPALTIARAFTILLALGILAVVNTVHVEDRTQARRRTAVLCIIHALPLYLTRHMGFAADLLGTKLNRASSLHWALGLASFFEGIAHAILSAGEISVTQSAGLYGLLALVALALLTVGPFTRRVAFEIFTATHSALAIVLLVFLWYHVRDYSSRYLVLGAVGLIVASELFRYVKILTRNCAFAGDYTLKFTRVTASPWAFDLVKLEVALARPWRVRPGQYVCLSVPSLHSNSWIQSHPFVIVSWSADHVDREYGTTSALEMVVRPARGWSQYVLWPMTRTKLPRLAFLDGPYGAAPDFGEYGSVLMIATGMGIFSLIPYIRGLFDGHQLAKTRTRKLRIYWQIEYDRCNAWIQQWMNDFLQRDDLRADETEASFLQTTVYITREDDGRIISDPSEALTELATIPDASVGRRLRAFKGAMDARAIARTKIMHEGSISHGGLLIAVSAEENVREDVRRALGDLGIRRRPAYQSRKRKHYLRDVDLFEMDYQPKEEPLPLDPSSDYLHPV